VFKRIIPLIALSIVTIGCANVPREAGFGDVEKNVAGRIDGKRVHWNQGTGADQEVAQAVDDMLDRQLSADDVVQIALLNNPRLQATYEDLSIAQSNLVQAGLLSNPVLDAEVRFAEGGGGTALELAVVQEFLDVLYIPLRKRAAGAAFESAKLRVTGKVLDLAGEVRVAYYELQTSQQLMEMHRQVLAATSASSDFARRLREAGNITELDRLNENAMQEQAKQNVRAAEADVALNRERLNRLMGLETPADRWTIAERLPDLPADDIALESLEHQALSHSLNLEVARLEVEQAARGIGLAKPFGFMTELELGASAEREPDGEWAVGPAMSMPLPVFNQGQPAVASSQARWRQARQEYIASMVEIRSRVRSALAQLMAARDQVTHYQSVILPLRQRITEETLLQYNAMQVGAFQLLTARQQQIEAGQAYIRALRNYWIARADLDQILAGHLRANESRSTSQTFTPISTGNAGGH
jgi:outer membrane protein, heavy metal efflux system